MQISQPLEYLPEQVALCYVWQSCKTNLINLPAGDEFHYGKVEFLLFTESVGSFEFKTIKVRAKINMNELPCPQHFLNQVIALAKRSHYTFLAWFPYQPETYIEPTVIRVVFKSVIHPAIPRNIIPATTP
jgi:hypothetical protein